MRGLRRVYSRMIPYARMETTVGRDARVGGFGTCVIASETCGQRMAWRQPWRMELDAEYIVNSLTVCKRAAPQCGT